MYPPGLPAPRRAPRLALYFQNFLFPFSLACGDSRAAGVMPMVPWPQSRSGSAARPDDKLYIYTPCSTSRSGERHDFATPPAVCRSLDDKTTKVTRIHLTRREKVQSSDGRAPPPRAGLRFTNRSNAKSEEVAGSRSAVPPIPALPPADGRAWPRVLLGSLQSRQASSPGSLRALLACVEAGASCSQTSCCV